MIRKIIRIDEEKCNGCGACAAACHEGAIEMINGKAKLVREDHCDGLGDCLPACPTGAITFETREAPSYNESAVERTKAAKKNQNAHCSCPGSRAMAFNRPVSVADEKTCELPSRLMQWPCQIKLVPVGAPYFDCSDLLIAADCCAFAYGNFHNDFMKGKITLIGCPKLDDVDYAEKLSRIIKENKIKSVTVTRMEVPCCGGIENAVRRALAASGKLIPLRVVTVTTDGKIAK